MGAEKHEAYQAARYLTPLQGTLEVSFAIKNNFVLTCTESWAAIRNLEVVGKAGMTAAGPQCVSVSEPQISPKSAFSFPSEALSDLQLPQISPQRSDRVPTDGGAKTASKIEAGLRIMQTATN